MYFFFREQFENMLEIALKAQICANLNFTSYLTAAMVIQWFQGIELYFLAIESLKIGWK